MEENTSRPLLTDLTRSDVRIERPSDVLDLVAAGTPYLILTDRQLNPAFFDLSTGFAGELVQKCVNYGIRVAIIRAIGGRGSRYFEEFARESNARGQFVFVSTPEEAAARLLG